MNSRNAYDFNNFEIQMYILVILVVEYGRESHRFIYLYYATLFIAIYTSHILVIYIYMFLLMMVIIIDLRYEGFATP